LLLGIEPVEHVYGFRGRVVVASDLFAEEADQERAEVEVARD